MLRISRVTFTLLALAPWAPAWGQTAPTYAAKTPSSIITPDTIQTRIGTLKSFDGLPDPETVQKVYDNLDLARGVEAFLSGIPAASVYAACEGLNEVGVKRSEGIGVFQDLMDARSLFLTPNSTTVYVLQCLDLKDGPMVVDVPPGVLGPVDNAYFRWVTDLGLTGPDKGGGPNICSCRLATPASRLPRAISSSSPRPTAILSSIAPSCGVETLQPPRTA
jgi:Protein of unknown function (DUF1254)